MYTQLHIKIAAFILLALSLFPDNGAAQAQPNANITFKITAPARVLTAVNDSVVCTADLATGEINFKVKMNQFRFVTPFFPDIMNEAATERFNNYYFDSERYPDCYYIGTIQDVTAIHSQGNGRYKVHCKGVLTMRGVSKPLNATGELIVEQNQVRISSAFLLNPRDFGMRIPGSIDRFYMKDVNVLVEARILRSVLDYGKLPFK